MPLYDMIVERYPEASCDGPTCSANIHAVSGRLRTALEMQHPQC